MPASETTVVVRVQRGHSNRTTPRFTGWSSRTTSSPVPSKTCSAPVGPAAALGSSGSGTGAPRAGPATAGPAPTRPARVPPCAASSRPRRPRRGRRPPRAPPTAGRGCGASASPCRSLVPGRRDGVRRLIWRRLHGHQSLLASDDGDARVRRSWSSRKGERSNQGATGSAEVATLRTPVPGGATALRCRTNSYGETPSRDRELYRE